ncbi:MAG: hypothetical protein HYV02_00450 [Deltaproteobacteria bacterium]|nr:hypothetical protein [Deltaproteobacteria bacterium]
MEIETKLDRLLDLQLDGSLSQTEYATKKNKLILAKKDLEEKIHLFERKSNNRFELIIAFLKEANQAENIAVQENPEGIRDFLKKIGSNFQIQNQNIFFSPRGAWQIVAKSAFSASPAGEATAPQVRKTSENSEIVNWRRGRDSNPRYR